MSDEPRTMDDKRQVPDEVLRVRCRRFSRIVGYLTAVEDWNPGKAAEFAERKVYRIPEDDGEQG
jgi:hypothetical protein